MSERNQGYSLTVIAIDRWLGRRYKAVRWEWIVGCLPHDDGPQGIGRQSTVLFERPWWGTVSSACVLVHHGLPGTPLYTLGRFGERQGPVLGSCHDCGTGTRRLGRQGDHRIWSVCRIPFEVSGSTLVGLNRLFFTVPAMRFLTALLLGFL